MYDHYLLIFLYKVITLLCGVFIIYLGYRLFTKGIFNEAGDLDASWKDMKLLVKRAAPGTFFALFGAIVIYLSVYKGLDFKSETKPMQVELPPPSLKDSINVPADTTRK
jgi:hypothetical protein